MNNMTDSNVKIGPKPIGTVEQGEEDNAEEFLGHLVFSTTGDVVVPREWLNEQWEQHNLPDSLFPSETSRWQAYRRAMSRVLEQSDHSHYTVWNDEYDYNFANKFELEHSRDMGSNVFILYAKTFYPEDIIGEEGGDWKTQRIGYFDFFRGPEGDIPGQLIFNVEEDVEGTVHYEKAKKVRQDASDSFNRMQTHHNYSDLQKVIDTMRERTDSVPIRRAVHFVGSHHSDLVEGFSEVWEGLNQFKESGEKVRIETTPVVNLESQREMIAERVRENVNNMVENIIDEMMEDFVNDEATVEETSREILNQLGESHDISGTYNKLLSMQMSVEEVLKEQRENFEEEQEQIIQNVIDQAELDDY